MTASLGMPTRGVPLLVPLGKLALGIAGWRITGALPTLPKFIIIVAPHTSNWDFPVGAAAMFALDLDIQWFGKDTLFRAPYGWLFRAMGGRAVRRGTSEGVVAEVSAVVRSEPQFLLALAPEGTRKQVSHWKTGFYRIAEAADVPIVPVWFDYLRKEVGIQAPVKVSGNIKADMAALQRIFRPEMARHPDKFWVTEASAGA